MKSKMIQLVTLCCVIGLSIVNMSSSLLAGTLGDTTVEGNLEVKDNPNTPTVTEGNINARILKVNDVNSAWPVYLRSVQGPYWINIGLGDEGVLFNNTTGFANIGIGSAVLTNNTSGWYNIGIGTNTLNPEPGPLTGCCNIGIGSEALSANTSGLSNTAIGVDALYSNTTGSRNTALGRGSLKANTTGGYNTVIGFRAFQDNTEGNENVVIGKYAGVIDTQGSPPGYNAGNYNVYIGSESGPITSTAFTNAIAIGYKAKVSASNAMVLGGTGADAVKVGIGTSNPQSNLHIVSSDTYLRIRMDNTGPGGKTYVVGTTNDNSDPDIISGGKWYVRNGNNDSFPLVIDSSDNVGIGTTTPQSKLAVAGLPTTPPDSSGNQGGLCVTNNGNIWVDTTFPYDCQ